MDGGARLEYANRVVEGYNYGLEVAVGNVRHIAIFIFIGVLVLIAAYVYYRRFDKHILFNGSPNDKSKYFIIKSIIWACMVYLFATSLYLILFGLAKVGVAV